VKINIFKSYYNVINNFTFPYATIKFKKSNISLKYLDTSINIWNSQKRRKFQLKKFKFLKLRKQELCLETLLFYYYKFKVKCNITNIFNKLNISFFLNIYKKTIRNYVKKKKIKKYLLLYYLFFSLTHSKLITQYFGHILLRNKFHLKNIKFCLDFLAKLNTQKIINFKGLKLFVSGKLNGKMRKMRHSYQIGKFILNTFSNKINFYYLPLYTRYGVISIKI
jgi:hypothetical protein